MSNTYIYTVFSHQGSHHALGYVNRKYIVAMKISQLQSGSFSHFLAYISAQSGKFAPWKFRQQSPSYHENLQDYNFKSTPVETAMRDVCFSRKTKTALFFGNIFPTVCLLLSLVEQAKVNILCLQRCSYPIKHSHWPSQLDQTLYCHNWHGHAFPLSCLHMTHALQLPHCMHILYASFPFQHDSILFQKNQ